MPGHIRFAIVGNLVEGLGAVILHRSGYLRPSELFALQRLRDKLALGVEHFRNEAEGRQNPDLPLDKWRASYPLFLEMGWLRLPKKLP